MKGEFARAPGARPRDRMIYPDRSIIATPEERPSPVPFRIRLGEAMHLNGTVPRGVPLEAAVPKRCATCGTLVIVLGTTRGRAYCDACRPPGCPVCKQVGDTHRPWCTRPDLRACRACQAPIPFAGLGVRYCEARRGLPRCPACQRPAGQHYARCSWTRPRRRNVPTYQGVVKVGDVLALYETQRRKLESIAARILGRQEAADVVQTAFTYLLGRLDTLTHVDVKLLVIIVMNTAKQEARTARHRRLVLMDDEGLLMVEMVRERTRWGKQRDPAVRLPEPVA
jgi:hypothetical protein